MTIISFKKKLIFFCLLNLFHFFFHFFIYIGIDFWWVEIRLRYGRNFRWSFWTKNIRITRKMKGERKNLKKRNIGDVGRWKTCRWIERLLLLMFVHFFFHESLFVFFDPFFRFLSYSLIEEKKPRKRGRENPSEATTSCSLLKSFRCRNHEKK